MRDRILGFALAFVVCLPAACATAEDPDTIGLGPADGGTGEGDTSIAVDSAPADSGSPDTTPADSGPTDTGVADSAPADSGSTDTAPVDTGTDTAEPVCAPEGKFGPSCATSEDCTAITGCGYICCAFDPLLGLNLGCGRYSPTPGACWPKPTSPIPD
jgi:hypothetical protein